MLCHFVGCCRQEFIVPFPIVEVSLRVSILLSVLFFCFFGTFASVFSAWLTVMSTRLHVQSHRLGVWVVLGLSGLNEHNVYCNGPQ